MAYYPVLEEAITAKGILKKDIAALFGIAPRSFSAKMTGDTKFSWEEVELMCKTYFSGANPLHLMRRDVAIDREPIEVHGNEGMRIMSDHYAKLVVQNYVTKKELAVITHEDITTADEVVVRLTPT